MSDRIIDNESSNTEGNRDSRSPQEKRGSAQDHYSKGRSAERLFRRQRQPGGRRHLEREREESPGPIFGRD
jgi:hypothetical protein